MKKDRFIAIGLTEKQAEQAAAAFLEEWRGFVPMGRFHEVNTARKAADAVVRERDKQLAELKRSICDISVMKAQMERLQDENKEIRRKHEAEMINASRDAALKLALLGKAHDADMVIGLLDKSAIQLDGFGNVIAGLEEQLEALRQSKAFLFVPEEERRFGIRFKGIQPYRHDSASSGSVLSTASCLEEVKSCK